jgi:hypothetical protein
MNANVTVASLFHVIDAGLLINLIFRRPFGAFFHSFGAITIVLFLAITTNFILRFCTTYYY